MTATSRVNVKTPKSGSERLELVLLEGDNKASISSTPNFMQSTLQTYQQQPTAAIEETRNDANTNNYLPQQYNNETNNIDDNSSYLTGCSASTAETDNRASAYRNGSSIESLDHSWSREYVDVNERGTRDSGGIRENGGVSDLYGSLEQCESIININNVLSNTGGGERSGGRSSSPVSSEPAVVKDEQPVVVEATNTTAAVASEEETGQPSSPTNLQYKKSVSFDQSLDELLTSATTATTSEEESSSSAASDDKKNKKKKGKRKMSAGQSSVKSEDTSVESVGYKIKTTFGSGGKKSTSSSSLKQATPSKGEDNTSNIEEEDQENNPSLSSQQQQKKKNRRKSAPKVLRVSKYSKQTSTSSDSSKAADTASDRRGPVDVDEVEVNKTTKGKTSSSSTQANDVESACSVVTEPLLDVLMREQQQQQHQNVVKEVPEVVQEQEKSVTRRELRKQRSRLYDDQQQYDQGNNRNQQQSRLQHRRTLPRDHPNYQSQRDHQYQYQYRDDNNSSIQRSNSNISNTTSLYSAYSNVALDGYVDPNLTNNRRKKEKREKKGFFRKGTRVAVKGMKGGKKLGSNFFKKVKDWYDDDEEDEYDVDDYGGYIGGGDEYRRDQEDGRAPNESSRRDSSTLPFDSQYSFEGYDHLKSQRNSPRGGSTPHPTQGNGTLTNPWSGIGGPQDQQGGQKVNPNFANKINPWSGIQPSSPQVDDNHQQQQGEYNHQSNGGHGNRRRGLNSGWLLLPQMTRMRQVMSQWSIHTFAFLSKTPV